MASQLLINEPPLQVLPTLARRIGLNEAIVLQQIHYWLNPQFNKNLFEGRYWVRNTYEQWQKQFPFRSERTLRRTIGNLEELELLLSCMGGHLKQIKFYTINYDLLSQIELVHPDPSLLAKTDGQSKEEEKDSKIQRSSENQEFHSSGQDGQLIWPKWPDKKRDSFDQNPSESAENKVVYPTWPKWPPHLAKMATSPGQSGQLIWPKWPAPLDKMASSSGQNDHLSYTETTVGEYSKNTLPPPLTPPRQFSSGVRSFRKKEEEEEKIKLEFKNAGQASLQPTASGISHEEPGIEETAFESGQNPENKLFSEMIAIWNHTVQVKLNLGQEHLTTVHLTDKRKTLLRQFLNSVFACKARNEKLDAWKDYCTLIAKLRFLTGENSTGFKVTLDWALAPDKAYKVLEGGIYDKPKPTSSDQFQHQSWEDLEAEIRQINAKNPYADTRVAEEWLAICKNLAKDLGNATFKSWFLKTRLVQLTEETATIQLETTFIKDYIDSHFRPNVLRAIQALNATTDTRGCTQINFKVATIPAYVEVNDGGEMTPQTGELS